MKVFTQIPAWLDYRQKLEAGPVGFVPTMGALHEGHLSLVRRCRAENGFSVASVFVNPAQFDRVEDLADYPRQVGEDMQVLELAGVDAALVPTESQIYPDYGNYRVMEGQFSKLLCGAHRPGHFDGVLNVVMRLFNIVRPARAYFGEKDWQQLQLVRGMVEAFFMDIEIVACPVVREADGLAMSSRNRLLNDEQRRLAPELHEELASGRAPEDVRKRLEALGFTVDYVEEYGGRRLAAASLGATRLIDNVESR